MNEILSGFNPYDPSVQQPPLKNELQVDQGIVQGNHVNLILNDKPQKVDAGVQGAKQPPEKVPANHMAVHVPSDELNLKELSSERYEGAEAVYMAARHNPEESLYARGKYWMGRMKNWIMLKPNQPLIEGVDQTFWGFGKDVVGEGWNFIYDQLKSVRTYGTGLFGLSSDVKNFNTGIAQIQLHNDFMQLRDDLSEAVESEFGLIDEEMEKALAEFRKAQSEDNDVTLDLLKEQGIGSEEDILKKYHGDRIHVVEMLTATLHRAAVSKNPDYIEESQKLTTLMEQVSSLEAQLIIAESARDKLQKEADEMSCLKELVVNSGVSRKQLDKAYAKLDVAKAKCEVIEKKLEPLKAEVDNATKRLKEKEAALLKEEGRYVQSSLEADADLGDLLAEEALKSAKWSITAFVNDILKTLQYGLTGLGMLGIPVVSLAALGGAFVTGGISTAVYGKETGRRYGEFRQASRVGTALNKMREAEGKDPELNAVRSLIEKNLSYKGKSIKTFFAGLSVVSTLAGLLVSISSVGAAMSVAGTAGTLLTIMGPLGWAIMGTCIVAGGVFTIYSAAKAIHSFYKEYKVESLLEEALEMRNDPGMKGSDAYNQLFMDTLNSVDELNISVEANERVEAKTLALMKESCTSQEKELELLGADLENRPDEGEAQSRTFDSLFNYYLQDELTTREYEQGQPIPSKEREEIQDAVEGRILKYIDQKKKSLEAIKKDLDDGTKLSEAYQSQYADTFRIVLGELEQGLMQDRVKIVNDRIIEQTMLKLMEQRPDYGLRILVQRIREGDAGALQFIKDTGVFKDNELTIIEGASVASESRVVELMMKRLGFDV